MPMFFRALEIASQVLLAWLLAGSIVAFVFGWVIRHREPF